MAVTMRQDAEPVPLDDYHVEGHGDDSPHTVGTRVIHSLQILMILMIAALSFAIFWVVGLMLHFL